MTREECGPGWIRAGGGAPVLGTPVVILLMREGPAVAWVPTSGRSRTLAG